MDKVQALQEQCDATVAEKTKLMEAQAQTALRLQNAEKLTSGLSSEGVRWKENLVNFNAQRVELIGDTLLSCAAISYYGPFTGVYREALVESWLGTSTDLGLPCSKTPSLLNTVGDPVKVREWQTQLLPTDEVSTNNAILVTEGKRWPLMIDPQAQANKWIRKMMERSDLLTTTMTDINLLRVLENAIRNGKPLLIEDVHEQIEPALEPVLAKATFNQGNRILIRLGDSNVDYDPAFKLFMTSKLPNPHYLPEVCIKTTIINFTVTMEGLEDQLLGDVVKAERPEVERKNVQLLLQMSADKKKLAEIEAEILRRLSEAKGNILDDEELINTLADSKKFSTMINERLEAAEVTKQEINEAREAYRTVATRGSIIYFVISDLGTIDPMYQYSLQYYQVIFNKCLQDAEASKDQEKRLGILIEYSTVVIYGNICRGLFEKDKVLYSALLAFSILRHASKIPGDEWNLFIRGPGVPDRASQPKNPNPKALPEATWDLVCGMEFLLAREAGLDDNGDEVPAKASPYAGLTASLSKNWDAWEAWLGAVDPSAAPLPDPFEASVTKFSKLIIVKALRDEFTLQAVNNFVRYAFGDDLADAPSGKMDEIYDDLDNATPCIFILSKGTDPTGMLFKLAKQKNYSDRLQLVSLGQGQGPAAAALVDRGTRSGDWVLLQNCMLAKSWMHDLELMVFELGEHREKNHPDFRLFLTSSPAPYFPVSVLQNGVKMTNEPPKGIRANLIRSYQNLVKPDEWETCKKSDAYKRLLSGLCFFHANVLERRKFGPLGWNIRYAFDESDLETSMAIMRRFLDEQEVIPWDALRFVTGHINYGGRVTDDWDRRVLLCILGIYFNERVMEEGDGGYVDYAFSASGIYKPATTGPLEEHQAYFDTLPAVDQPEIFGMHENANITFNRAESSALMGTILALQPRESSGGGGKSSDDIIIDQIDDIEGKMPENLDEEDKGPTTFVLQPNGLLTSLDTVLLQEMVKFNRLMNRMRSSLRELRRAIGGFVIMSSDLDDMYTAFLNNQLPPIWRKVSFETLKTLGSWVKDNLFRIDFMRSWLLGGLPTSFALPVFFFPQGFMTGTLQTYARKHMVAIDTLEYEYEVLKLDGDPEAAPRRRHLLGLNLEGALVLRHAHGRREPHRRMYTMLPMIHFKPAVGHTIPDGFYACPVYKTAERKGVLSTTGMSTNFVVAVELPSSVAPERWVLAGVAALLNLTD
ncbi:dynein light chain binding protein [Aureococcus anophagefferens]|nr:dynein light chain binding protein [Aureococcus anophagefferens]